MGQQPIIWFGGASQAPRSVVRGAVPAENELVALLMLSEIRSLQAFSITIIIMMFIEYGIAARLHNNVPVQ